MRITKPYQLTKPLAVLKDAYKVLSVPESLHLVKKKNHGKTLAKFREFLLEKVSRKKGEVSWPSYNLGTSGSYLPWN